MATARAILSPEQQNMERRLRDCDGCHNPEHRPVYQMRVDIGTAHGGTISQSIFLVCEPCSRKPIHLYLHGSGHCAPGIRTVDESRTLGRADVDHPVNAEGTTIIDEGVVEPPVEVVGFPERTKPRARARTKKKAEPPPPALDACTACGHQRGFHIHGPCGFSFGRGCSCRGFQER